jgi:glycosyltransferase involved in cell wall biosynthesis
LLFSSFADRGRGGQESLFHLACLLDRERFRPFVVVPSDGRLAWSLRENGIDVAVLKLPRVAAGCALRIAAGLGRLAALVDQTKADILHTDGPRNTFYAALVGRLKCKPVIWHVRAFAKDSYDWLLYRMCSRLILVADSLRGRFDFGGDPRKLVTIHNGVDLDRFKPEASASAPMNSAAKRPRAVIIATVGRIEAQKGLLTLLQACRELKRTGHGFQLRVAGEVSDRPYFRRCQDFCREAGLAGQIEYAGHVQEMEALLTGADIFVLPSKGAEAFPRSVLEAMACGKPVIVTDAGGSCEAVENGENGFVVSAQAPLEVAGKLRELIEDESLRTRMGRAGRQRAEARFGAARNADRTMQVYTELLRCR